MSEENFKKKLNKALAAAIEYEISKHVGLVQQLVSGGPAKTLVQAVNKIHTKEKHELRDLIREDKELRSYLAGVLKISPEDLSLQATQLGRRRTKDNDSWEHGKKSTRTRGKKT